MNVLVITEPVQLHGTTAQNTTHMVRYISNVFQSTSSDNMKVGPKTTKTKTNKKQNLNNNSNQKKKKKKGGGGGK